MKQQIESLIYQALRELQEQGELTAIPAFVQIDHTKDKAHGDFACNIAMVLAKTLSLKPREIAQKIIQALPKSPLLQKIEIAGPGFINFFLSSEALQAVVSTILVQKEQYGRSTMGRAKKVLVEFLSANPTGPLHVGHGRHAAFGAVIANLLEAVGFDVFREYYVNDAGRQMDILAASVWLRYLDLCGEKIVFPANAYRGEYVIDIAKKLLVAEGKRLQREANLIFTNLPLDEAEGGDKEHYIDALVQRAKEILAQDYEYVFDFGLNDILADIRDDLAQFGVQYDHWFSEKKFVSTSVVDELLKKLDASGHVYQHEGALWFRATAFGDEKDRVLVRENGQRTYFANDVAYHLNKFERGFDIAIDIFGADHHGYVPRMKAAIQALGINPERLLHLLVQFVTLYRGKEQVQMSTRGGEFVTLRELREEVGNDAARFFYVMRKNEQHVDFDLNLAKSQSNDNPIYYLHYAYARICSVLKLMTERGMSIDVACGVQHVTLLVETHERQLLTMLTRYPDVVVSAALHYEPHQLTHYLRELAADFHAYYNAHQFIVADKDLREARIALVLATQQTLANGFKLLGIHAPESM